MIDPSCSRQKAQEENAAALARWRRLIILTVAGLIFIGAGLSIVWGFGGTRMAAPSPPVREQASNELVETTKALRETQQQAVDQLQVVQDQLLAHQDRAGRPNDRRPMRAASYISGLIIVEMPGSDKQ
jgi:hypothetical protein